MAHLGQKFGLVHWVQFSSTLNRITGNELIIGFTAMVKLCIVVIKKQNFQIAEGHEIVGLKHALISYIC